MDLSSSLLKNRAKTKLRDIYWPSFAVSLVYTCIFSALSSGGTLYSVFTRGTSVFEEFFSSAQNGGDAASAYGPFQFRLTFNPLSSFGSVAMFLLAGPLMVGLTHYFLHVADRNDPQFNDLFGQFKNFGNTCALYLLTTIFTFLWTLLFIIPGIIAGISYAMAPYIVAEHPEIRAADAIRMSKDMMKGHKGEYFILQLSFIGWFLLSILTLGIGFIFLSPYLSAAEAEFFNEVSGKNIEKRNCGIDPDGPGAFFGDAPAAAPNNGFGQPVQQQSYNGYGQPVQQPYNDGYSQPTQQPYNGGYCQTDQPQNSDGFTPPAPPQDHTDHETSEQP